jgi:hypothetical protein
MRPQSIIMFERLFLLSIAVSAVLTVLTYDEVLLALTSDPGMRQLGLGSGFLIGVLAGSFVIYLLLWHLISHRASNAAKWILVVLVALGTLSAVPGFRQLTADLTTLLSLAGYALEIGAVAFLFRADATAWFKGKSQADPATFD